MINEGSKYSDFLFKKIERIVREDGDDTLNIERFLDKMCYELRSMSVEKVAQINAIPIELVEMLDQECRRKNTDF